MEKENFLGFLNKYPAIYEIEEKNNDGSQGILVKEKQYKTLTFFSENAIRDMELDSLIKQTHHGRNIEQITRVTGYFSKVNSWNKGKKAELKDRYRSSPAPESAEKVFAVATD